MVDENTSTVPREVYERLQRDYATYQEALSASQLKATVATIQVRSLLKTKADLEDKLSTLVKRAAVSDKHIGDLTAQIKRLGEQAERDANEIVDLQAQLREWKSKRWFGF